MADDSHANIADSVAKAISISICGRERGWQDFMPEAKAALGIVRDVIGDAFLTGHSGCEGGPFLKLKYETNEEALRAHGALAKLLQDPA